MTKETIYIAFLKWRWNDSKEWFFKLENITREELIDLNNPAWCGNVTANHWDHGRRVFGFIDWEITGYGYGYRLAYVIERTIYIDQKEEDYVLTDTASLQDFIRRQMRRNKL
jgi:hypothetical protein